LKPLRLLLSLAALACPLLASGPSSARRPNPFSIFPPGAEQTRAFRYSALDGGACRAELTARKIPFSEAGKRGRIEAPVKFEGKLRGVAFEFRGTDKSAIDVLDCRLLLALDDLAETAAARDIAEVHYNSVYRLGHARGPVQGHVGGVAIDITELVKKDGTVLNVLRDFSGNGIGSATCGPRAKGPKSKTEKATELWAFVCALDEQRLFNLLLTPHYDYRHRNHFHFELRRNVRWFLTQ
jgi:hypothetical protein